MLRVRRESNLLEPVFFVLFVSCWITGVAAWFYAIYEMVAMQRLSPAVFRKGRIALEETRPVPVPTGISVGEIRKTRTGKYRFVTPQECLFCQKFAAFSFRLHTPFPLKCAVTWSDGLAQIEGRLLVGTTVFSTAWLCGWTVGGLTMIAKEGISIEHLAFTASGLAIVAGVYLFSVPLEIKRANRILQEILEAVPNRSLPLDAHRDARQ
jgi:hypothetical protein